ncbi:CPBP family intramembrane glutamic endopeptidase [Streptococcus parauberis]|uniref:CAAX amino terminal protease family protein n=1 Tax=Streptococcus parauberis NCFD 2020 TaxID=873447 RepID=F1YXE9_9STRE|nr:CPBP family intramembrane glutamic endopeptidase [Streptococcus parauberis]EGE54069.1 CAAX amino terminal protease family protein [Streptococcus parauberis NCFD 2020]PNY19544.1 CAAX amino terminal protease self- immunity [Streptococcus parauberis]
MKQIFKSIGFALLMVIFPTIAGVLIQLKHITDPTKVYMVEAFCFFIAVVVGYLIYRKIKKHYFFASSPKIKLYYLPIILIEICTLIAIPKFDHPATYFLVLLAFTIFVGISEELFFRAIILRLLSTKSITFGIMGSSLLFGLLHMANLAGGSSIIYVCFQIVFAFLFGLVAAYIVVIEKSLLTVIIWHAIHDYFGIITGNEIDTLAIIIVITQCLILLAYAIYLHRISYGKLPSIEKK